MGLFYLMASSLVLLIVILLFIAVIQLSANIRISRTLKEEQQLLLNSLSSFQHQMDELSQKLAQIERPPKLEAKPEESIETKREVPSEIVQVTEKPSDLTAETEKEKGLTEKEKPEEIEAFTEEELPAPDAATYVPQAIGADLLDESQTAVEWDEERVEKEIPASESMNAPAKEAIIKIWNWLTVGEEFRAPGLSLEYAVASTWLLRLGILALVLCVAYFIRWSIARELIGPAGRVAMSMLAGVAMLVSGIKLLGKKYHLIGQGLLGGGLAVLYFTAYAAGPMYKLIPIYACFLFMIMITVTSGILAIRADSMLIAILGIIGGFTTPILLKTGTVSLLGLYSYILTLSAGILWIAVYREWRLVNYLAFIFTYVLFFLSMNKIGENDFFLVITFLSLFFMLHSSLVYINNILQKKKSTVLEILHMMLNTALYAGISYYLIMDAYGRPYPAIMSVALAAFFVGHIYIFLRKRIIDSVLLQTLLVQAAIFSTWTMPLLFTEESLTISWSLQALAFLWLGYKLEHNFIRHLAYLLYAMVFLRVIGWDTPRNFNLSPAAVASTKEYMADFGFRIWTFGMVIFSIISGFFIEQKRTAFIEKATASSAADSRSSKKGQTASEVFYWVAIIFVFTFLYLEFNTLLANFKSIRPPVLSLLWCGLALFFLWRYLETSRRVMLVLLGVITAIAILKIIAFDLSFWNLSSRWVYRAEYTGFSVFMRLIDFGGVLALCLTGWSYLTKKGSLPKAPQVFGYAGIFVLFFYSTLELNSLLYWKLPDFQKGGVTILWAIFAIVFTAGGIWKNIRQFRYSGLCLFLVVVGKIFLFDLADMQMIYRVIAFMILGLLMLFGSFAYISSRKKFLQIEEDADNEKT